MKPLISQAQPKLTPVYIGTLLVALIFSLLLDNASAAPDFPALSGRVVDQAGILSPSVEQQIERQLSQHEQQTSNQVVVVTLKSLQGYEIEDYGYQLGRHWGIGTAEHNNGVLLIVAPNERKVRIEVGYGLEGSLTDVICNDIIQSKIIPYFKQQDYEQGVLQGANAILSVINGEYQPTKRQSSTRESKGDPINKLFIIGFFCLFAATLFSFFLGRFFGGLLGGLVMFIIAVFMTTFAYAMLAGVIVFVLFLVNRGGGGGGYYSGGGGGGFSGGSSFSGGGGSFGGGGSSGSW